MNATLALSSAGYSELNVNKESAASVGRSGGYEQAEVRLSLDAGKSKAAPAESSAHVRQQQVVRDEQLASVEREVKSEEQNLKARAGSKTEVFTVYHYAMGEDGRRYVTGASVTMRGDAKDIKRVSDGAPVVDVDDDKSDDNAAGLGEVSGADSSSKGSSATDSPNDNKVSEKEREQVQKLKRIENEVIAHEAAHMASAGSLGGAVSYSYTQGPDGKKYITGGEVPIELKAGSTPQETIRNMEQVQRAALAPGDPSGQDRSVAAKAASVAAMARSQLAAENAQKVKSSLAKSSGNFSKKKTSVAKGTPVFGRAMACDKSNEARQVIANTTGSLKSDKSHEAALVMAAAPSIEVDASMNGAESVKADYMRYVITGEAAA